MTARSWRSRTTVLAAPEDVIDTLTDTAACSRWSPVPFAVDIRVAYALTPLAQGCAVDAHVSVEPSRSPLGRVVASTIGLMLTGGTLDLVLSRIAREAERSARRGLPGPPS